MMDQANMGPTKCKTDALSRETTLAEGQVEELLNTTPTNSQTKTPPSPPSPQPSSDSENINNTDGDHQPYAHPSDPGAHKPPGAAGYAHLAEFMTATQYGMVRKHKDLSLLDLLYRQAEIHALRAEWEAAVAADGDGERRVWDYHWGAMARGPRWEVWQRLRGRLGEYCALG